MIDWRNISFSETKDQKHEWVIQFHSTLEIHAGLNVYERGGHIPDRDTIRKMLLDELHSHVYGDLRGPITELYDLALKDAVTLTAHNEVVEAFQKILDLLALPKP